MSSNTPTVDPTIDSFEVIWEEPPPTAQNGGRVASMDPRHVAFREVLKSRPGTWARWPEEFKTNTAPWSAESAHRLMDKLRKGRKDNGQWTGFSAATRTIDGVPVVFVRYNPESDTTEAAQNV